MALKYSVIAPSLTWMPASFAFITKSASLPPLFAMLSKNEFKLAPSSPSWEYESLIAAVALADASLARCMYMLANPLSDSDILGDQPYFSLMAFICAR